MPMTPEELELLTPEERAGLELEDDQQADADEAADQDDDDQDDDQDADDSEGGEDDDADDDNQDGAGEDGADDGQEDDGEANDGQPGRDDGADPDTQDESGEDEAENPDRPVAPEFSLQAPEGVEDKLKALDTLEDELTEKFDDGDMTATEYRKALRDLGKERDEITWSVRKYEQAKERHDENLAGAQQQWMQKWYKTAGEFVEAHPEIARNKTVMQVFDNIVQGLNTEENINKFSHQRRLEMAYKQWAEDLGVEVQQPSGKGKQGKTAAKKATPPKKRDLPPSLGKVPAAAVNETDDGTYGTLNRLFNSSNPNDVAKAEDMLGRMSEADQDRYLRSN